MDIMTKKILLCLFVGISIEAFFYFTKIKIDPLKKWGGGILVMGFLIFF